MVADDAALIPGFMDNEPSKLPVLVSTAPSAGPLMLDEVLLPELQNVEAMKRTYNRYITTFQTLDQVAAEAGVDIQVAIRWARKGDWKKRREELLETYSRDLQAATRLFADKERLEEVQAMLRAGRRLRDIILRDMDAVYNGTLKAKASEIKSMAEALVAASTVTSRAVGLSENGQLPDAEAEDKARKGKQPLVMIHIADAVRECKTIDVTEESR